MPTTCQETTAQAEVFSEFHPTQKMRLFDPKDFARDPGKFELFRTAVIAVRPMQHQKSQRFQKLGECVAIKYMNSYPMGADGALVPYYMINGDGYLSASYLGDFVL